ncbi:MAG: STAS domain-containing protein [Bacteroidales bacterium]
MKTHMEKSNEHTIVEVFGRLDTVTAGDFETKLLPLIEAGSKVVIDCTGLDYISSSGLRIFLLAQKKAQAEGGQLKLCSLQPSIMEIFTIAGFSNIFALFPDQESACRK